MSAVPASFHLRRNALWSLALALLLPITGASAARENTNQTGHSVAEFLDGAGRLQLPEDFAGSLDPAGYRMVLGADHAPSFVPETGAVAAQREAAERAAQAKGGVPGEWLGFGGVRNGCNGAINKILRRSDGSIIVAGTFSACADVRANNIARYTPNTNTWASLGSGSGNGVSDTVFALVEYDGDLIAAGNFTQAGAVPANFIARWNGSSWASLGAGSGNGTGGVVLALTVFNTELIAGGAFSQAGGTVANRVARWNRSTWAALGTGSGNGLNNIVITLAASASTLYVGGQFSEAGGVAANRIASWNGASWATLGAGSTNGVNANVWGIAVSGNSVYAVGSFTQAGAVLANYVARFSGGVWSALGSGSGTGAGTGNGLSDQVNAVTVNGSDLYVGGAFDSAGGVSANNVAHWNGTRWVGLSDAGGTGVNSRVDSLTFFGGNLHVGGNFNRAGGVIANSVARWDDREWRSMGVGNGNGVNGDVHAMVVRGGDMFIGGRFTQVGGVAANNVARWDGSSWDSLGRDASNGVNDGVLALAIQGNNLFVGGEFSEAGGIPANHIARWDGRAWFSLGTGATNGTGGTVRALAVSFAIVYAGGSFITAGGVSANGIAQWNGSSWFTLGSGIIGINAVNVLTIFGNDLYVGGSFTQAGGIAANRVARWNGAWFSLGADASNGVNNTVFALTVSAGNVFVGGRFTQAGGAAANMVARWNGSSWTALGNGTGNGTDGEVLALFAGSGGDVVVGGNFTQAGGLTTNRVARWTGTSWESYGSGNGVNGRVRAVALFASGANAGPYVGGTFAIAGDQVSSNFARWSDPGTFTLGGTVSGMVGGGLRLHVNGGNTLLITANGAFSFPTPIASGTAYAVTVATPPTAPMQACTVSNGSGTVGTANVSNILVNCAPPLYSVSGIVSGLSGSGLVLRINGGNNLAVANNGIFTFPVQFTSGSTYAVTVFTQPNNPAQTCTVVSGIGTIGTAGVSNIVVNCAAGTFTVGGTVTGLSGSGLVLRNNGGNNLNVPANGAFTFSAAVATGGPYAVTVFTPPSNPAQTCTVSNGSGAVGTANITNIAVACTTAGGQAELIFANGFE